MLPQAGFDLTKLDAKAADFDLEVVAAKKVNGTVGAPTAKIARLIHAGIGLCGKRVRNEPLGRKLWPVQITPGHARAANVNLACHPDRHGLKVRIQNINSGIRDRTSYGVSTKVHFSFQASSKSVTSHCAVSVGP